MENLPGELSKPETPSKEHQPINGADTAGEKIIKQIIGSLFKDWKHNRVVPG